MGSRDSRSLNQATRREDRQSHEADASDRTLPLEPVAQPSALVEGVVRLDEPTAPIDPPDSSDFRDDATVCGKLVSAQTEWMTDDIPLALSDADDVQSCDVQRSATPLVIPDRSHELDELHQQLGAKDELISALVGELEQVVEQLDRMQRMGGNRSQASSGGVTALPASVVEEHQQVLGDLQRVVQQWEALQASSVLGRIEAEVGELRLMMARSAGFPAVGDAHPREAAASDNQLDDVLSRLAIDRQDRNVSEMQSNGATWEVMKRRMMGGDEPLASTESKRIEVDEVDLDAVVAPRPVDLDAATQGGLQQACAERDAYIVQLTRMLRSRSAVSLPDNWDDILEVPEEQKARVDQLATRLEEQVRLAEVEMSLERARLSRERTQLQAAQEKIDKHLKRLGLTSLDELEGITVENGSNSDRRWMRFLGVNRRG